MAQQLSAVKKILLIFGATLFVVFASLQVNDATQYGNQDAWLWIVIYGLMAAINLLMLKINPVEKWLYSWAGFTWGCVLFRIQDEQGNLHFDWMHPANYWDPSGSTMVQQANESGGLVILALWATLTIFLGKKMPR